jgi:hypothetical protein
VKLRDVPPYLSNTHSASLLAEQSALLTEKEQIIERKSEVISAQQQRIQFLEEMLRLANRKRFKASSEQSDPLQLNLFDEAELETQSDDEQVSSELDDTPQTNTQKKKKPGRKPFADSLPREQVRIYLSDEEKAGAIDTFFTKVKEELDIIPAKVRVLEYMQEKAVFVEQEQRIIKAAVMLPHYRQVCRWFATVSSGNHLKSLRR